MTKTVCIYQWWLFALKSTICKVHRLCLKPQGQALIIYGLTWFSDVMVIKLNILWQAVNNLISWKVQDHLITAINMWNYIYCNNDYRNILGQRSICTIWWIALWVHSELDNMYLPDGDTLSIQKCIICILNVYLVSRYMYAFNWEL